jgi:hypothetical protein
MGLIEKAKLLWKFRKVQTELEKARKEGTLDKSLRLLGHALALTAPLVGAYLFELLGESLGKSNDPLMQSIGAILGALVPLMRRMGSPDDRKNNPTLPGA